MNETSFGTALWQAMIIAILGCAVGVFYNHLGLEADWGIPWKGEKKTLEDSPSVEELLEQQGVTPGAEASTDGTTPEVGPDGFPIMGNDPLAVMGSSVSGIEDSGANPGNAAVKAKLDAIPDLGRPLQIQLAAVKEYFDADAVVIVDAREPHEFEEGRIAGSVNLPYDQAITDPAMLENFDSGGKPLVVYCGGGTCELSINLGWSLIEAGHPKVFVFMGGYPEWKEAGYPTESGAEG